ncbi:MAG: ATP-dependent DNA helicase, partial [Pseudomonadota bacterium]
MDVTAQFEGTGRLAELLEGFQPRPSQARLAERIGDCLTRSTDLIAEAATGTGKTLAYLIPALEHGGQLIISTGTLNLQDQLFQRDLPLALKTTQLERKIALLKGRGNYLCGGRLALALANRESLNLDLQAELDQVSHWSKHTTQGEIRELAEIGQRSSIWPLVTCTADNCLSTHQDGGQDCYLFKARRIAQAADIVVVNHHLLFADLALKQTGFGEVLPDADAVIVDEAHQIPGVATRFFSRSVSAWQLSELGRDSLAACATATGALHFLQSPIDQLKTRLAQLASGAQTLPERGPWKSLTPLQPALQALTSAIAELNQALEPLQSQSRELGNCFDRSTTFRQNLDVLLAGDTHGVRWFSSKRGRLTMNLTPLDIAEPFRQLRAELPSTWIMTSATLAVNG